MDATRKVQALGAVLFVADLTAALGAVVVALTTPSRMMVWGLGVQGALRLVAVPALSLGVRAAVIWTATSSHLPRWVWLVSPLMELMLLSLVLGRLLAL